MTEASLCVRCRRPVDGATLCPACIDLYLEACRELGRVLPELDTTISRSDRVSRGVRHGREEPDTDGPRTDDALEPRGLVVNFRAAETAQRVRGVLAGWVRHLANTYGVRVDSRLLTNADEPLAGPACQIHVHTRGPEGCWTDCKQPATCWHETCIRIRAGRVPDSQITAWLARHAHLVRQDPAGDRIVDDLRRAARDVEWTVDNTPPDAFAGRCDAPDVRSYVEDGVIYLGTNGLCGAELWARPTDDEVTCTVCGYTYQVAERRQIMLDDLRTRRLRIFQIVALLARFDMRISEERLKKWVQRDRKLADRPGATGLILGEYEYEYDEQGERVLNQSGQPVGHWTYLLGDVVARIEAGRAEQKAEVG